jgi:hypothetical protein
MLMKGVRKRASHPPDGGVLGQTFGHDYSCGDITIKSGRTDCDLPAATRAQQPKFLEQNSFQMVAEHLPVSIAPRTVWICCPRGLESTVQFIHATSIQPYLSVMAVLMKTSTVCWTCVTH